jgi:predicted nuclease of predicted toxin-antitoxin system
MIYWVDAQLPMQLLWVTCGNVTNRRLQSLLMQVFPKAQRLLAAGEAVVEITDIMDANNF